MKASPQPGEVWIVDFGYDGKLRAAVVVSIADGNARLAVPPHRPASGPLGRSDPEVQQFVPAQHGDPGAALDVVAHQ